MSMYFFFFNPSHNSRDALVGGTIQSNIDIAEIEEIFEFEVDDDDVLGYFAHK